MFMHRNLPVNFCGGFVSWRLYVLHYVAKALGLLVKVEGFPYGTRRNLCNDREPCCGNMSGGKIGSEFSFQSGLGSSQDRAI